MGPSASSVGASRRARKGRVFLAALLDLFSNVWFGVFWAVLLFIYCSIGSAIPVVRQLPALEMTEFEWFHWWPFNTLVVLFCTSLIVTTVRRIPFRVVNLGVWTIHTGMIVLALGSYYYFGTKIEGDAPVFRRQVTIALPGLTEPATMLAVAGNHKAVTVGPDEWHFEIQDTNTEWPILSEEHKGEKAYAVNVAVKPPSGDPFVRQLLVGYPQYTEDILPGRGRAIKAIGRKLFDEQLQLSLDYEPQKYFHVMDTWALFVRRVGETDWVERPIAGLPRYNDRVGSRELVFTDPHTSLPLRPIDLPVGAPASGDALGGASVRITSYLRYAREERRWKDGGERVNPVLQLSVAAEGSPPQSYELIALDPAQSTAVDGNLRFLYLSDSARLDQLPTDSRAVLRIKVPEANVALDVPLSPQSVGAPMVGIEGTEYSYRVADLHDGLALPGRESPVSIAVVEIKTPQTTFRRWVADQPELTRDMRGDGADPHSVESGPVDRGVEMTYQPRSAPLLFAAHPGGLHFVFNGPSGRVVGRDVRVGESIEFIPGVAIRVDSYFPTAVAEVKPYIVPPASRQRSAGESFAMVRLEVDTGNVVQSKWVHFNQYVFPDAQYAYGGRFAYSPERFRLADGSWAQVVFSRRRVELPYPIAMEDFALDTHLGGYSGSTSTIRNYVSRLRFLDGGAWTPPTPIAVNHPTEYGGYWYFQSTWDRPPQSDPTAGMNYTGLGVGNRHGVYLQLAGCCIAAAGMFFAFYVKPVLKRRRAETQRAKLEVSLPLEDRDWASSGAGHSFAPSLARDEG
jgi:hypothetical protein